MRGLLRVLIAAAALAASSHAQVVDVSRSSAALLRAAADSPNAAPGGANASAAAARQLQQAGAAYLPVLSTWQAVGCARVLSSTQAALTQAPFCCSSSGSCQPGAPGQVGALWAPAPLLLAGGFFLSFNLTLQDACGGGADGLTFLFHADTRGAAAIGCTGGNLGANNNGGIPGCSSEACQSAIAPAVGLVLTDGWGSYAWAGGLATLPAIPGNAVGAITSGVPLTVNLSYTPGTLAVRTSSGYAQTLAVDIAAVLGSATATVGFTAATGSGAWTRLVSINAMVPAIGGMATHTSSSSPAPPPSPSPSESPSSSFSGTAALSPTVSVSASPSPPTSSSPSPTASPCSPSKAFPAYFFFTGAFQYLTFPCDTMILVSLWGAAGGSYYYNIAKAGAGAYVSGKLSISAGTTLRFIVGMGGSRYYSGNSAEVNGGGGDGGIHTGYPNPGGGGRSAIQIYSAGSWTDIVSAGGGGGTMWGGPAGQASWNGTGFRCGGDIQSTELGQGGCGGGSLVAGGAGQNPGGYLRGGKANIDCCSYQAGGGGGNYGGAGGCGCGGGGSSLITNLIDATGDQAPAGSPGTAPGSYSPYFVNGIAGGPQGYVRGRDGLVVVDFPPTPSASASVLPSTTVTLSISASATQSSSPSTTLTESTSAIPSPSVSASTSASASVSASAAATVTTSATPGASVTVSTSPSVSSSLSGSVTASVAATPTRTASPSVSPLASPSASVTVTSVPILSVGATVALTSSTASGWVVPSPGCSFSFA